MSHSLDPPALTVRAFDTATVLAFVVALCVPLCVMLFGSMQDISTVEQRMLAAWPPLPEDARALRRFPRRVERAFTDHLGLRLELTRAQAALEAVLFATSPTSKIVVGRDGWLFFGDADAMGHARHVQPLGPHALARWADVLEARRIWLRRHGAEFLFVLVPDKHHVYSEHLPRGIVAAGGTHPIEQLSTELARRGSVPTLDLLPILEAAKPDDLLYHKTDTHWNDRGAYIAYAAILEAAGRLVPELADDTPVAVVETPLRSPGLGLAQIVGLARFYHEDMLLLAPAEPRGGVPESRRDEFEGRIARQQPLVLGTGDPSMPRAVVFRDSFANALVPFLSEHFERVVWVWDRDVLPEVVVREQPDIVIQEVVGRFLERRPKGPWESLEASVSDDEGEPGRDDAIVE